MSFQWAQRILIWMAILTPRSLPGSSWYYAYFRKQGLWDRLLHTRNLLTVYLRDAHEYPYFVGWQKRRFACLRHLARRPVAHGGYLLPKEYTDALLEALQSGKPIRGATYFLPIQPTLRMDYKGDDVFTSKSRTSSDVDLDSPEIP